MKRFICFLSVALALLLMPSCKDVRPEFKFQMELTGDVSDSVSNLKGDFIVNVTNDGTNFFKVINESDFETMSIAEPEGFKANSWLDNYIQENVIDNFSATTEYLIHIKGYVQEEKSGIVFSVDKTFTNK